MRLELSNKLKKIKKMSLGNPQLSYLEAGEVLKLARQYDYKNEEAYAIYYQAYASRVMSDYPKGLEHGYDALEKFKSLDDNIGIMEAENILGIIYFYYGNYTVAHDFFSEILMRLEQDFNANLLTSVHNNIGEIYRFAEKDDQAMVHYNIAVQTAVRYDLDKHAAAIYLNISDVLLRKLDYKGAYEIASKSFEISKYHNDLILQGECETRLGRAMFMMKNYKSARRYYISGLEKFNMINNKYYIIELLIYMAELEDSDAPKYLFEALDYAEANALSQRMSKIYQILAERYENQKEYENALKYWKLYHFKEKEVEAENLSKKLEILSLEFEFHKNKAELKDVKDLSKKLRSEIQMSYKELKQIKIENNRLMTISNYDMLTGVYNRRGINQQLSKQLNHSKDMMDLILIIDIDHFKTYNDFWGHVKGDGCLKAIASTLSDLKFNDYFVGRYGGEEFLCYCKIKSEDEARSISNIIKDSVYNLGYRYNDQENSKNVTISIGGCFGHMDYNDVESWIDQADMYLYDVKSNGRNNAKLAYKQNQIDE